MAATSAAPGLALPAMGAGGAQSLAGSLATGTHGAEMDRQPLMDAIRAVHVGPGGQEWWIERSNGFSERSTLSSSVPRNRAPIPGWSTMTGSSIWCSVVPLAGWAIYADGPGTRAGVLARGTPYEGAVCLSAAAVGPERAGWFRELHRHHDNSGTPGLMFAVPPKEPEQPTQCWVMERRIHLGPRTEVGTGRTRRSTAYALRCRRDFCRRCWPYSRRSSSRCRWWALHSSQLSPRRSPPYSSDGSS